jgi:cyclophilin family peptidyl-prolyl cis-trans isomerase
MRWIGGVIAAAALFVVVSCSGSEEAAVVEEQPQVVDTMVVVLETNMGSIAMELYEDRARETVRNFVRHVRSSYYDGLTFYRVKPGFMIQAGIVQADGRERHSQVPPLANEADNGLKNLRGTLAMARQGDPHSAKTDFFINVVDNPALDFKDMTAQGFGYAVFGSVIEGMDVVDAIAAVPTTRKWRRVDVPVDPVVIARAYIREAVE